MTRYAAKSKWLSIRKGSLKPVKEWNSLISMEGDCVIPNVHEVVAINVWEVEKCMQTIEMKYNERGER